MLLFQVITSLENQNPSPKRASFPAVDEALIPRIAQGDQDAFYEIYMATHKGLYGFALSVVKNTEDAEDVLQETYLRLRMAAHLYKPQGKPMAWLCTIVRNLSLMKIKEQNRTDSLEDTCFSDQVDLSGISDIHDRMVLKTVLAKLPADERQIVMLHTVTGLKHREIAQVMQIPLATVLSKYSRALKKLKGYLEKEGFLNEVKPD